MSICCLGILFFSFPDFATAQNRDSSSSFKLSGYIDVYYARYSDSVGAGNFSKFPDIAARDNTFGLNVFQLTGQYTSERIRATGTLHYGDLVTAAWSPA